MWLWQEVQTMSRHPRVIHAVAGIIINDAGKIFVAQRPAHVSYAGLWEFPGGKIEIGETPLQALTRELHEEIGIKVIHAKHFMNVKYDYPDRFVDLDVWWVENFKDEPYGAEGQIIDWVTTDVLKTLDFPAANNQIVIAVLNSLL